MSEIYESEIRSNLYGLDFDGDTANTFIPGSNYVKKTLTKFEKTLTKFEKTEFKEKLKNSYISDPTSSEEFLVQYTKKYFDENAFIPDELSFNPTSVDPTPKEQEKNRSSLYIACKMNHVFFVKSLLGMGEKITDDIFELTLTQEIKELLDEYKQ